MIDFKAMRVGDQVTVVGMGAPGFAQIGEVLTITKVMTDRVYAAREDGGEAFFALTCGASRLEKLEVDHIVDANRKEMVNLDSVPREYAECPFCHEKDFDLIGLKSHFEKGYCEQYNETEDDGR